MSDITQWSPVDANNSDPPPDGWPENAVPINQINDGARAIQGSVRRHFEDQEWRRWADDATYVSGTSFQVPGDQSAIYLDNRPLRITGVVTTTIYGKVASTTVTTDTIVNVTLDSGAIANEAIAVSVGSTPLGQSVPYSAVRDAPAAPVYLVGEVKMVGGSLPPGYLECNGSAVSRTTYADLFAAIGTSFGVGDGSTTFGLPDLQGRSPMGLGTGDTAQGGGAGTARSMGDKAGAEGHTLVDAEVPATNITPAAGTAFVTRQIGAGTLDIQGGSNFNANDTASVQGGGGSHNNMSPALAVRFVIRHDSAAA